MDNQHGLDAGLGWAETGRGCLLCLERRSVSAYKADRG